MRAVLPHVQLIEGQALDKFYIIESDGVPSDWTGSTGTWTVRRDASVLASGVAALPVAGKVKISFTAADVAKIVDADGGRLAPSGSLDILITGPAGDLSFQAAVTVWRKL